MLRKASNAALYRSRRTLKRLVSLTTHCSLPAERFEGREYRERFALAQGGGSIPSKAGLAYWLGNGFPSRLNEFDSRIPLHFLPITARDRRRRRLTAVTQFVRSTVVSPQNSLS